MSAAEPPIRLVDRIPADAKLVVHLGDGTELGEAFARINPETRWVSWDAALDLPPRSAGAVVVERPLPGGEAGGAILARAVELLAEGGLLLAHGQSAHFHGVLAATLAGGSAPADVHVPEAVVARLKAAGATVTALIAGNVDEEGARAFIAAHPEAAATTGVDAAQQPARVGSPDFLVQAIRGPMPPPMYIYARMRDPTVGANRAMADVRVMRPLHFLAAVPNAHLWLERDPTPLRPPTRPRGIFLYQRPILRRPYAIDLLRQLVQRKYVVVIEFDDHPNYWPDIAAHDHLTYAGAHAVQTSTEPLARVLRQFNPNVAVFRNDAAELPPLPAVNAAPTEERPLRIFYGSLNRAESMRPLVEAINRMLRSTPLPVHVSVIADRKFHDQLQTARKEFHPMVDHARHRQMVEEADIVLLPLADTVFNRCKSDLSFVEAAARGAVVLASPIVYGETVVDGETGMIFRSPAEFEAKLNALVGDPGLRARIAGNAHAYVRRQRMQKDQFRGRWQWYQSLLDRKDELDRGLRERVPELREA